MPAVSVAQALQIIRDANDKMFRSAATAEQAGMRSVLGAKAQQVSATVNQTKGETLDSITKFASSGAGLMTNMKLAEHGAGNKPIRQQKDEADAAYKARTGKDMMSRAAASSLANSGTVPQLFDKATEAFSQAAGAGSMINQAKIDSKLADLAETQGKNLQDGFKQAKDAAQKAQDGVNDMQRGIYEREKQVADNVTK